jgi:ABC-type polysaccharide/polyol phosphate transport system ATPase subunit
MNLKEVYEVGRQLPETNRSDIEVELRSSLEDALENKVNGKPTKADKEIVIQARGLGKSYREIDALKPLTLAVHENSIFGFLGPNGAGKTTTIKLLLGLIRPTSKASPFEDELATCPKIPDSMII